MPTPPPVQWTEAVLEALSPTEHDFQEFKGARFVCEGGKLSHHFQPNLSKQLSAFANGAGGRIFLGLDDDGVVDGGVPMELKGGGTRAWLEDIIPGSVDPPLRNFNVFEVPWPGPGVSTRLREGCAIYVLEIPASDEAPHQAVDHRYYLRIAGKSRPMGHVHIQDVLRRTRHPVIDIARISPYGSPEHQVDDPRGPKVVLGFRAFVANRGRNLATHVGVEVSLPRTLVNSEIRGRILGSADRVHLTQKPGQLTFFRYHPTPLFPSQEIFFLQIWIALHSGNADLFRRGRDKLRWRVYADDAPAREGEAPLKRFSVVRRSLRWLKKVN